MSVTIEKCSEAGDCFVAMVSDVALAGELLSCCLSNCLDTEAAIHTSNFKVRVVYSPAACLGGAEAGAASLIGLPGDSTRALHGRLAVRVCIDGLGAVTASLRCPRHWPVLL